MKEPALPGAEAKAWPAIRLLSTHHRAVGARYLLLALLAVALGTALSLAMRLHLVAPDSPLPVLGVLRPEDYLRLVTMHGTLMVFFVLTTAPLFGFANLVLPAQIGAAGMAFPRLNSAASWLACVALLVLVAALVVPGGAPISGWSAYPPLSAIAAAGPGQGLGMDLWLVSLAVFCLSAWVGSACLLTTVLYERAPGMRWGRLPLTVWSWVTAAGLVLLAFAVLLAAIVMLLSDRHFDTSFFVPAGEVVNGLVLPKHGDGSPLLWLHLFWFFGHPEVYIAVLPGMGITSSLLADFARRPVLGYRLMVATTLAIAGLGLVLWGHHMFVSGMNPYAGTAFAITTMAIAIPSAAKVLSWLGTLWAGRLSFPTPMLFALGFVSLFITGGLSGPLLAEPALDSYLHNTFFVVAHFHLIMAMAGVFSIFAGVYYWFPLLCGRLMGERLGRWHFALTFVGAYLTFFPMHFAGLAGEPRHYERLSGSTSALAHLLPLQRGITHAAFLLAAAQLLFLVNLLRSWRRGELAGPNPWRATTLEWAGARARLRPVLRGPYCYGEPHGSASHRKDFLMQCDDREEGE